MSDPTYDPVADQKAQERWEKAVEEWEKMPWSGWGPDSVVMLRGKDAVGARKRPLWREGYDEF